MRRSAAAALAAPLSAMLLLSGCSSIPEDWKTPAFMKIGEEKVDKRLPKVTGKVGEEPKLDFPDISPPKKQISGVVKKGAGEGALVRPEDKIVANVVDYSWTGKGKTKKAQSTYDKKTPVLLDLATIPDELRRDLVDNPVGSRVVYVFPPQQAQPGQPAPPKGSSVSVVDIQGRYGKGDTLRGEQATDGGEDGMPTVTAKDAGEPKIKVPDSDPPKDVESVDLIEGDGPKVEKNQQIVAQYKGVTWKDSKVFDSTWKKGGVPAAFLIGGGQVIKGWDEGLVGKKVGSRVLLTVPEDKAYGKDAAKQQAPEGALVFVVDILGSLDSAPPLDEEGGGKPESEADPKDDDAKKE
ncbi:peptidylprolyl isomerase [Murinocardiopsis flavida]|uniref:peptidylprolyl isomerase n=1 Tax=Murinocardiopsis flavida TaxID=645275 RepID=A0A2P8DLG1_9ACTN|nr:FKBP-type peptidyl-prolyl cis-trans isomerase [Murinocardiopsis flavida]PSK98066.1 peptidylprolyl isomerase [Murinocardiopsis flavida]